MESRVKLDLSVELAEKIDENLDLFGFVSREQFVEVAVRRLLDRYTVLAEWSRKNHLSREE